MTLEGRSSYRSLVEMLEHCYGKQHLAEVFWTQFWACGEPLQVLAYDLEQLAHKAYPGVAEATKTVLLHDELVDALEDAQLQLYVRQAHIGTLQEALACALECVFPQDEHSSVEDGIMEQSSTLQGEPDTASTEWEAC